MKKFLSYLGLIATLLAIPNLSKADDLFKYYLIGNINNWGNINNGDKSDKSGCMTDTYFFGQSSSPKDAVTWSKDFSGVDLLRNVSGTTAYFKIWVKQIYNGNENDGNAQYYLTCTDNSNTKVNINGNAVYIDASNTTPDDFSLYIEGVQASHTYRITFVSGTGNENDDSRKKGTIKVVDVTPVTNTSVNLIGPANSWTTETAMKASGSEFKLELTKSQVEGALDGSVFKFRFKETMSDNSTYNVAPSAQGTTITVDAAYTAASTASTSSTSNYWQFTPTGADNYTIYFKNENGTRYAQVVASYDYYWVSPQITNNGLWEYFKMVPSRNRNMTGGGNGAADGRVSIKYYTFTIKNDDLKKWDGTALTNSTTESPTKIQWYIVRSDEAVLFRPTSNDPTPTGSGTSLEYKLGDNTTTDTGVGYINFQNDYKTTDKTRAGFFEFNKGYNNTSNSQTALAYTFMINSDNGNVYFDYASSAAPTSGQYDLVGNFSDAKGNVPILLNDAAYRKDLTKYWYYNGTSYTEEQTDLNPCDSIVYKVEVQKPANGWGDLYIDVIPDGSQNWNQAFRPLISLGNNLDGRALHGALTTANSNQSLNPEPSDNYQSYTFSFNATTRTYNLEFNMPDATLSPGYDGSNVDLGSARTATITVNYSNETAHATPATKCYITGGSTSAITLDETSSNVKLKNDFTQFTLRYDESESAIYMGETKVADGKTVYFKIRGEDAVGAKGDIHTYQYTFHTPITMTPMGGLFINKKAITFSGTAPYTYSVKDPNTNAEIISGTIDSGNTLTLSTPGVLKVTDSNNDSQTATFDFTYSTSENYVNYYNNEITSTEDLLGPTIFVHSIKGSGTMPYFKALDSSDQQILGWTAFPTGNSKTDGSNVWYYYSFGAAYHGATIKLYFSADGSDSKTTPEISVSGDKYFVYDYDSSKSNETSKGCYLDMTGWTVTSNDVLYVDKLKWGTVKIHCWDSSSNTDNIPEKVSKVYTGDNDIFDVYKGTPTYPNYLLFYTGSYSAQTQDFSFASNMLYQHWGSGGDEIGKGKVFAVPTGEHSWTVTSGTYTSTYSKPNGADYYRAVPSDKTYMLDPKWGNPSNVFIEENSIAHWSGYPEANSEVSGYRKHITSTLTQTISGLNKAKEYTVQALVRATGENGTKLKLTLNGESEVSDEKLARNGSSGGDSGSGIEGSFITKTGRVEYLTPTEFTKMNKQSGIGWFKLQAKVQPNQTSGNLQITIGSTAGDNWFDLADVVLLEDADNTDGTTYRTTATKINGAVTYATGTLNMDTYADYRDRSATKNNAFSFFDRGENRNAVIFADKHTVIALDETLLTDDDNQDHSHPYNVVATNGASDQAGVCPVLYITDQGVVDPTKADDEGGKLQSSGSAQYKGSGYTFKPVIPFTAANVVYDRTYSNTKSTVILPFSLTQAQIKAAYSNDVKVYTFSGYNASTKRVEFAALNEGDLAANTPFILFDATGTLDSRNFTGTAEIDEAKVVPAITTNIYTANIASGSEGGFTGRYDYARMSTYGNGNSEAYYGYSNGQFLIVNTAGANMKPFRAFFTVPYDGGSAPANALAIDFFEPELTGISTVEDNSPKDGFIYSVNGMLIRRDSRTDSLPKGIYILNGRKFVVK